jgi:carboxypeptidase D
MMIMTTTALTKALLCFCLLLNVFSVEVEAIRPMTTERILSSPPKNKYKTNEELRDAFDAIAKKCVETSQGKRHGEVIPIGSSVNGFEIFAMRVRNLYDDHRDNSNNGERTTSENEEDEDENVQTTPSFGFIGNMHGDEPVGREITLRLAEWACGEDDNHRENEESSFFGNDIEKASKVKTKATLYFIPTLNPDGFAKRRRENANNIDLNRDFPFIEFAKPEPRRVPHHVKMGAPHVQNRRVNDLYDNTLRQLQPETRSIIEFSKRVNLTGALNYHEGALVANYPWDGNLDGSTKYSRAPDDKIFKRAASLYAQSHGEMKESKEFVGGVTNGAQWYPLWGGMQDWHYVKTQTLDITIEVNDRKWPSEDEKLGEIIRAHCRASIDTAHDVMFVSARGFVFDKSSNEALEKCEVRVENLDFDRQLRNDGQTNKPPLPVFTNKRGYFVKPVFIAGETSGGTTNTFEIMVTCPDASQTHRQKITDVDVSNGVDLVVRILTSNSKKTVDVKQMAALRASSSSSSSPSSSSFHGGARSQRGGATRISPKSKKSKYILFGVTLTIIVILARRQRRRRAKLNVVRKLETNGQTFLNSPVPKASSLIS